MTTVVTQSYQNHYHQPTSMAAPTKRARRPLRSGKDICRDECNKNLRRFLEKSAEGYRTLNQDQQFEDHIKSTASSLLSRYKKLMDDYSEMYNSTKTKRSPTQKLKYCDIKLTRFLSNHFKVPLPENGTYGIIELNAVAPAALSLYLREQNLSSKARFKLDAPLFELFNSPSINDPSKTYLELGESRIQEIQSQNQNVKRSDASAMIQRHGQNVTMNYAALKIIVPKFGIKYDITNPEEYRRAVETFKSKIDFDNEQFKKHQDEEAKRAKKMDQEMSSSQRYTSYN